MRSRTPGLAYFCPGRFWQQKHDERVARPRIRRDQPTSVSAMISRRDQPTLVGDGIQRRKITEMVHRPNILAPRIQSSQARPVLGQNSLHEVDAFVNIVHTTYCRMNSVDSYEGSTKHGYRHYDEVKCRSRNSLMSTLSVNQFEKCVAC